MALTPASGFAATRIAVTSGKGGVGKTSISVNVAVAMARLGHQVGLVDADLALGNVDVFLGLTPEDHLGDFVSDLQQRRAIIQSTQTRGKTAVIEAEAPLSNLFGYSGAMRGLSQGRASCSMEPAAYGPAPPEVLAGFL